MITTDRYLFLYESNATGANLAPIDFSAMQEFENDNRIDASGFPTVTEMKRRLATYFTDIGAGNRAKHTG